ncbi:MAG: UDP-3-O-[3-hydroxymyristoyl] N-acetylglucosamine deacetylase [Spirochaetes bacterium]|nr:UDP-3-O-[3-hydroxymyristoyl] N-acetylglucosamine deacetylase [Spirochaetota bacterium]
MKQSTINREVSSSGIALHSGERSQIIFKPAPDDYGVVFFRSDIKPKVPIPANWKYVTDTVNKVAIGREGIELKTVEHVLSALYGLGVDNCIVEINNIEPPNFDGSSKHYVDLILEVGLKEQEQDRKYFEIPHPIWMEDEDKYLIILPSDDYRVSCSIEFNHNIIQKQSCHLSITNDVYLNEIAGARTFGFWKDVSRMWESGLALGGSFNSALVYDNDGILNESLRFDDECVRHKILDLIGDFALLGRQIKGHVIAYKSGHALHVSLVEKMGHIIENNLFSHEIREKEEGRFKSFRKRMAF